MSTMATRAPSHRPLRERPVNKFWTAVMAIERHAIHVRKLPLDRLLSELPRTRRGRPALTLRRISGVIEWMEELRLKLAGSKYRTTRVSQRARTTPHMQALIREGALLRSAEFISQLNWTRQALSKALAAHRVFFVEVEGARYYPAFFADPRYERRHVEAISRLLGDLPGMSKLQFMTTPKGSLSNQTPLQAVEKGLLAAVKVAAESFAER
jgi:hypothetical protein